MVDPLDPFKDLHAAPRLNERVGHDKSPNSSLLLVREDEADPHLCELAFAIRADERYDLLAPPIHDFLGLGTACCDYKAHRYSSFQCAVIYKATLTWFRSILT